MKCVHNARSRRPRPEYHCPQARLEINPLPSHLFDAFCVRLQVIYDLLDPNNRNRKGAGLEIREHGVLGIYVKGLQVLLLKDSY